MFSVRTMATVGMAVSALAVAAAGPAAAKVEGDTITLGSAISFTGKYSTNGIHAKNGYDIAIKKINEMGGVMVGGKTYKLTVPGPVPGKLFWSNTVYDNNTRTLIATDQDRAAVRSHLEKLQVNADGSYDLYFGPKAPAGKEGMWIKTIPGKGWWSMFRIYGPQAPAFDGTWKLDDIVEMK